MSKKTVSEVDQALRDYLKASVLFTDVKKPNGILSFDRLNSSVKEDVIIEPLAMTYPGALQQGVKNINIFVPNLKLPFVGGGVDESQRNQPRIAELERLVLNAFTPASDSDDAIYFDGYNFTYQQAQIYADTNNQHYINVRIEYNAITV